MIQADSNNWCRTAKRHDWTSTPPQSKIPVRKIPPRCHWLNMIPEHISDHDLERYYLGIVAEEEEVAQLEVHMLIQ